MREKEREREKRELSPLRFIRAPPCCVVGRFIRLLLRVTLEAGSYRCVSVGGSHGSAIDKDSKSMNIVNLHIGMLNSCYVADKQNWRESEREREREKEREREGERER